MPVIEKEHKPHGQGPHGSDKKRVALWKCFWIKRGLLFGSASVDRMYKVPQMAGARAAFGKLLVLIPIAYE
ncbi:hypothetical protein DXT99_23095 [Pontibacter diazotrophicus]|uniref:Uncharacterized protein n=1 Tax=Pontibacter diazotrophicus TaxID=1400979 RepID=A0A3D8L3J8_9BACT|nr:hypothetical protein DXT99_23095 [Pontibacter diazotrophicus]